MRSEEFAQKSEMYRNLKTKHLSTAGASVDMKLPLNLESVDINHDRVCARVLAAVVIELEIQ